MRENTSSIGPTRKLLMFQEEKMLKAKPLLPGKNIMEPTRDGRSSILTRRKRKKLRDLMKIPVSTETDHSISDPDSQ